MKTILDQISIPSLCECLLEMAHTHSAHSVSVMERSLVQSPGKAIYVLTTEMLDTMEFFVVFFLCFDFVPFVGDPQECKGYVAFPPILGPREGPFWACQ